MEREYLFSLIGSERQRADVAYSFGLISYAELKEVLRDPC